VLSPSVISTQLAVFHLVSLNDNIKVITVLVAPYSFVTNTALYQLLFHIKRISSFYDLL